MSDTVNIIIPVYNRDKESINTFKRCINSVIANTDKRHSIIIIDDLGPGNSNPDWTELKVSLQNHPNIRLYINGKNLGYTSSCNVGLLKARDEKRHAVLLNSDTVVSKYWLDGLLKVLKTENKVGTVTPLSNNATIYSIFESGTYVAHSETDDIAEKVFKLSSHKYPEIPVAHGFCYLIRDEVIQKIGLLDNENFKIGYGEECDYSLRAMEVGFTNVLADDTYVFHQGSASFREDSKGYLDSAARTITKLYPYYDDIIRRFVSSKMYSRTVGYIKYHIDNTQFTETDIKNRVEYFTDKTNHNIKNVLLIDSGIDGGSGHFVDNIIKNMDTSFNIIRLTTYIDKFVISNKTTDPTIMERNTYYSLNTIYHDKELFDLIATIIERDNIDLVFVNSLIFSSFSAIDSAYKLDKKVIYIGHDFNLVCPTNHMIREDGELCNGCKYGEERPGCLTNNKSSMFNMGPNSLFKYRKYFLENILHKIERIVVPSEYSKTVFMKTMGIPGDTIRVIKHGIDLSAFKKIVKEEITADKKYLNVAVIGQVGAHKGSHNIKYITDKLQREKSIRFFLIGFADIEFNNSVLKTGKYDNAKLSELLSTYNIDVALFVPAVGETFSYTMAEVTACGIPMVASDIGAQKERLQDARTGILVSTADEVVDKLIYLSNNIVELNKYNSEVKHGNIRNISDMVGDYIKLFSGVLNEA